MEYTDLLFNELFLLLAILLNLASGVVRVKDHVDETSRTLADGKHILVDVFILLVTSNLYATIHQNGNNCSHLIQDYTGVRLYSLVCLR